MDEQLTACLEQLRALAKTRVHCLSTAVEVDQIGQVLCNETTAVIREVLFDWNRSNSCWRLPPELFAASCRFLTLRELITVSHVSRSWRSAVLQFPALWSDIWIHSLMKSPQELLRSILERVGNCPLEVSYTVAGFSGGIASSLPRHFPRRGLPVGNVLSDHMHHVRTLVWCDNFDATCFRVPAPLLTELRCEARTLIPEDFLGGVCASLTTLSLEYLSLPAICPALSTVVTLSARLPTMMRDTANLPHLFEIFKKLESLSLRGEFSAYLDVLPPGPAPTTLRKLELVDYDESTERAELFSRWKTDALKDVHLSVQGLPPAGDSSTLLQHAVTMALEHARSDANVEFTILTTTGSKHVLDVEWIEEDMEGDPLVLLSGFLCDNQANLQQLRSLRIPIHVLLQVEASPLSLPALTELTVSITDTDPEQSGDEDDELQAFETDAFAFVERHAVDLLTLNFVDPPTSPEGLKEFLSSIVNDYCFAGAEAKRPRIVLRGVPDTQLRACGLLDPTLGVLDVAAVLTRSTAA
ncbi:hypothetical protein AURDEDRAFT_187563 [Auricularia subglabra TFB-10046 SS5]|nr:hypothetical protein AURDEDRAFT_187563 [Auricularia subglabra TFB-10046 SS5]